MARPDCCAPSVRIGDRRRPRQQRVRAPSRRARPAPPLISSPAACTQRMGYAEDCALLAATKAGDVEAARAALDAGANLEAEHEVRPAPGTRAPFAGCTELAGRSAALASARGWRCGARPSACGAAQRARSARHALRCLCSARPNRSDAPAPPHCAARGSHRTATETCTTPRG